MAVRIDFAVFDRQKPFGILRCHTEKCRQPHPQERTRAAGDDRRCDPDDIARADGGGKSGAQGAETGNFTLTALFLCKHIFERAGQPHDGQKNEPYGEVNPRAQNQHDERDTPYEIVDFFDDLPENFHLFFAKKKAACRGRGNRSVLFA